jgi:hypothetical protein
MTKLQSLDQVSYDALINDIKDIGVNSQQVSGAL